MTTATRKTKTATPKPPLLQQGDRIRGTSPEGHQHAGTFEGYSSKDLILCKEGERTIALNPASVERVTEPAPQLPTRITEVNSVAIYQGAAYYSEPKHGAWRLASDAEIAALEKGDRVSESDLPWVYKFVDLGGDETDKLYAVCAFVDHPCFHYRIPFDRLQIAGVRSQESEVVAKCENFHPGDRVRITKAGTTKTDENRLGIVQSPWDSQQQAAEYLKVLLDGDEVCRAFKPDWVKWVDEAETPMQALGALLPTVEASIVTSAQTETAIAATRLETLTDEILTLYSETAQTEDTIAKAGRAALSLYLAMGEKLLAVKAQLNHGQWLPWLKEHNINDRKAQRAILLHSRQRELTAKFDTLTNLTLTEALEVFNKKALKPALEIPIAAQTPDTIEQQYALTGDHATPTLEELMLLYSQLGTVKPWKKGFAVERDDMSNPFPLAFRDRASAWKRWQAEWRSFAASHPLPATEAPVSALPVIPTKTEGLESEKRAVDPYEYESIESRPVWFDPGDGVAAGQAIAANGKGMVRINWGRGKQSDVPGDRVQWSAPELAAFEPVPAFDTQNSKLKTQNSERPLQPNGLVENRPACSRWEPEEVANVARIQLQGLLKHLEPVELVKAAIVQSQCSLVDAAEILHSLANKEEFKQILEVFWRVKA